MRQLRRAFPLHLPLHHPHCAVGASGLQGPEDEGICPSPSGSRAGLREGRQLGRGHTARWWDQSWQTPEPQDPSR